MENDTEWVCECRRCNGVFTAADAVQYVWEWALGSCGVPTVVGVNANRDGFVGCAFTYWHGEPAQPHPIGGSGEFMVSCRPGAGTAPTEGDVARWASWGCGPQPPRDWLLVDEKCFRSVPATVEALRGHCPMPIVRSIVGDWNGDALDSALRDEVRENWTETAREARAFWRL